MLRIKDLQVRLVMMACKVIIGFIVFIVFSNQGWFTEKTSLTVRKQPKKL
jgi:hypothetical protein